jgi:hypothetical protein
MTLFTGAVAVGMTNQLSEMREEKRKLVDAARLEQLEKEMAPGDFDHEKRVTAFECADPHDCMLFGMMTCERKSFARAQQQLHWARTSITTAPSSSEVLTTLLRNRHGNLFLILSSKLWTLTMPTKKESVGSEACGAYYSTPYVAKPATTMYRLHVIYAELSLMCWDILQHPLFMGTVNATILAASCYGFANLSSPGTDLMAQRMVLLTIMKCVYLIEFLVKVIAQGSKPYLYFTKRWNCFDFVVLFCTLYPDGNKKFSIIRGVRLVKILNVSPRYAPQFHVVLAAFSTAVDSFAYVGIIWVLMMYMFGIVGVEMYSENDPRNFATLHEAMFSLFRASTFGMLAPRYLY